MGITDIELSPPRDMAKTEKGDEMGKQMERCLQVLGKICKKKPLPVGKDRKRLMFFYFVLCRGVSGGAGFAGYFRLFESQQFGLDSPDLGKLPGVEMRVMFRHFH